MDSILKRAKLAAKTALGDSRNVELTSWIGSGPSIKARARLAIATVFFVSAPILFLGVIRTDAITQAAGGFSEYDRFVKNVREASLYSDDLKERLWSYETQFVKGTDIELGQEIAALEKSMANLSNNPPSDFSQKILQDLSTLTVEFTQNIEPNLRQLQSMSVLNPQLTSSARVVLVALMSQLDKLEERADKTSESRRTSLLRELTAIGRDQLILFLIMLFTVPIFIGFVPYWIVLPMVRVRRMSQSIEGGRIHELSVYGTDEVSVLARTLKQALVYREELEQKKSSKIFEIRNVLRSVISQVEEPILIVDRDHRINYANKSAGALLNVESHNLEGALLADCVDSQELIEALEKAEHSDNAKNGLSVQILVKQKTHKMRARLSSVHDREGDISRVVIVLVPDDRLIT